jgi:TolB protein
MPRMRMTRTSNLCAAGITLLSAAGTVFATQSPPAESRFLTHHVQLTMADDFCKAGEAYFSPDMNWVIFQAIPQPKEGETAGEYYLMYVAKFTHDETGRINGIEAPIQLSPDGSSNTCGWFHPTVPGLVLFGCTLAPPDIEQAGGYSRDKDRYSWAFPNEMEVVSRTVPEIVASSVDDKAQQAMLLTRGDAHQAVPIFSAAGYDAEGSWSPDGRAIMYTNVAPGTKEGDIYVYLPEVNETHALVTAPGYDGGPFFSPDGKYICYRSDRNNDNLLQVFVAELTFDERGLPVGVKREIKLTDNLHVNWAPFWHPSGKFLVYATSEVGHHNYEVFAVSFNPETCPHIAQTQRITHAEGFDGLPVFSSDGRYLMWTAQRGSDRANNGRATSQIWLAEFKTDWPFETKPE